MSFLTPLYLLGLLAVAGPILFHLIRRTPKGETPFSSLMFLSPSPPKLTRRSRLDQWFLLLLRALALILLALAFMRPFLRETIVLDQSATEPRRIAILVDVSASLRRDDLWENAKALADETIAGCRPDDQIALIAFDSTSRVLLGFDESATLDPSRRQAIARGHLAALGPTWGATNLGQALIDAVAAIEDSGDASATMGYVARRIVLVSDLQQGSRLAELGDFEWPSDVDLELKTVTSASSNAGAQWLTGTVEGETTSDGKDAESPRVRVTNAPSSRQESFKLAWIDAQGTPIGDPVAAYVPPGESRVVRVPPPPPEAADSSARWSLRLSGDSQEFDNRLYLATEPKENLTVVYLGSAGPDDPGGLLYYLKRVFDDSSRRSVRVIAQPPSEALALNPNSNAQGESEARSTPLVIFQGETTPANAQQLRTYALNGGTVLLVAIAAQERSDTLAAIADAAPVEIADGSVKRDLLLGEIAFDHPLFSPFAGAQFNDFTKIRFWKYRRVDESALGDAQVLARFENGDPAILEKRIGKGRLVVFTSGWSPADSQLALSSKFVPLMTALLEGTSRQGDDSETRLVGDRVPIPADATNIRKPDGSIVKPNSPESESAKSASFADTDEPGVYVVESPRGSRLFTVNLDPDESKTDPLNIETLEQFGCRLAQSDRQATEPDEARQRQMRSMELESRQKLWRWLILAAIGILIIETWLAGRLSRTRSETLIT